MLWNWKLMVTFFGRIALRYGLQFLETKYPGVAPILDKIVKWLEGQTGNGNGGAVQELHDHVDKLCSGIACPMQLKDD